MESQYPFRTIYEVLDYYLKQVEDAIKKNMQDKKRNASGASVRSLRRVIKSDEYAYLEGLKSFWVMERGRKGFPKEPYKHVPKGFRLIIKKWILDKGISVKPIPAKTSRARISPYERGLNSMAAAIAWKIATTGTRLHRQKGYDDIFTSTIEAMMPKLSKEIALWAGDKIDRIHQKAL